MAQKYSFTSRTKARKRAVDVVFEADQRGMGSRPGVLFDLLRERKVLTAAQTPLPEYSIALIEGVAAELRRIDRLISENLTGREIDRLPAVDLAIMRIAVFEMLAEQTDVEPTVAIDEAVKIARITSTSASPQLVNAVLDSIRRALEAPAWQRDRVTDQSAADEDIPVEQSEPVVEVSTNDAEEISFAQFAAGLADGDIVPVESETDESDVDFDDLDALLDEY